MIESRRFVRARVDFPAAVASRGDRIAKGRAVWVEVPAEAFR